jgi:hypothetical protein
MKRFLASALLLLAAPAFAQRVTNCSPTTPNNALCVEWQAPATNVDGSPTVQPMTYRLEQKVGATGLWVNAMTGLTTTRAYVQNLAPGLYFFRVYVNCATCTGESAASNEASRAATAPPRVPTSPVITIAVVISPDDPPTQVLVNGVEVYASATP